MIDLNKHFKMKMPIAEMGTYWNGRPEKWSNLPKYGLHYSQKFGVRPDVYKQFGLAGHNGNDIAGMIGTPIVAPIKLWISTVESIDKGYGTYIKAETETIVENGDHVKVELCFGHLSKIVVDPYHWWDAGKILGFMGNTGFSSGPHLHFGFRPWISPNGLTWEYMFKNSFAGYIDAEPFLPHMVWDYSELNNMFDPKPYLQENDLKLIRNSDTGEIGWIYDGKVRTANTAHRFQLMLANYLHRTQEGITVNKERWDQLPKKVF